MRSVSLNLSRNPGGNLGSQRSAKPKHIQVRLVRVGLTDKQRLTYAINHVCSAWSDEGYAPRVLSGTCDWSALQPTMHDTND